MSRKRITIDRFGRVLIPKKLRDDLGLAPGSELGVERSGESIVLIPRKDGAALVEQDGMLVHTGEVVGDIESATRSGRDDRILELVKRSWDR